MKIKRVSEYLKETYGKKMYKLSISGNMTCPNRDGKIDTRGCIFCPNGASDGFSQDGQLSITEQIEKAKNLVKQKNKNGGYIAYFQTYTNTYAPIEKLEKIFFEAISHPDIDILSIATRPDCLDDSIIDLLNRLNKIKPIWIELGLQTIHEKTAQYIRRGYELSVFDEAVKKLKNINIHIIVHLIIGLPFETTNEIVESAKYVGESGVDGIKLQLLHILRGCDLEKEYLSGKVKVLSLEEYSDILCECLKVLPEDMIIHRITGDGAKKHLIAPLWSTDKKRVLNYINQKIEKKER